MNKKTYVIISPCRNEEQFMRRTLDSVINQSVQPTAWVIVDDGSTDRTPAILAEYAAKHPFVQIITRVNRGHRSVGPGVIEAFYAGYKSIDIEQFNFLCKLDLDLELPPDYFKILLQRMEELPRLGCCSGKPYYIDEASGKLVSEKCGDENSVGMTKFYRKSCFLQIGGFVRQVMWDGIDGHRCRMLGWVARSWDEVDLRFIHLRPMGSSQKGILTGRMRHGFGQYFMGSSFVYMTLASLYRMSRPPVLLGGLAIWWGYVYSLITNKGQLNDPAFRKFLRQYQWACLLKGKTKATEHYNQESIPRWNPRQTGYPLPDTIE
ncbi:MAG: glycosyltransferase family 2 protein [Chlorobium sp.]|nr:glycosyltransferase family 2 protein [Chlorobium sp.]